MQQAHTSYNLEPASEGRPAHSKGRFPYDSPMSTHQEAIKASPTGKLPGEESGPPTPSNAPLPTSNAAFTQLVAKYSQPMSSTMAASGKPPDSVWLCGVALHDPASSMHIDKGRIAQGQNCTLSMSMKIRQSKAAQCIEPRCAFSHQRDSSCMNLGVKGMPCRVPIQPADGDSGLSQYTARWRT